jgi:hypothetical protein
MHGGTSQSIRVSKLKLAEVLSTGTLPYHVTADVREELKNLLEEGMLVRIESLVRNWRRWSMDIQAIKRKEVWTTECNKGIYGGIFWCFAVTVLTRYDIDDLL